MTTKVETCGVVTGTFIIVSDLRADRALVFRIDVLYKKRKKLMSISSLAKREEDWIWILVSCNGLRTVGIFDNNTRV